MNYVKKWSSSITARKKLAPEIFKADTIPELLRVSASLWPERTYLVYAPTGESFTYREFAQLVERVGEVFRSRGIKKGDRIGLFMKNSPLYLASIFACGLIGAVEVPVNWFYREKEVGYILGNSSAKIAIADDDLMPVLENVRGELMNLKSVIRTTGADNSLLNLSMNASGRLKLRKPSQKDLFAIIYTSGTTGMPKGAMLSHRAYTLSAKAISLWPIENIESDYTCLPLFHINAQIYSSLSMMAAGSRLILSDRFSPQKFWEEIKKYKASAFNALGSLMQIIYSMPPGPLDREHGAKYVIVGGTPKELWERFEERFGVQVLEGYSQTEDPLPFVNHPEKPYKKIGSFGVPSFWDLKHQVKVINEKGGEVKKGEKGELIRRSPCTMTGYWRDKEKTREAIKKGWLYSGDVVTRDKDGFTYFIERKKFIIRRSGENIAAWEVEAVIKEHPSVKDCAVIPVPEKLRGEEVKAIILQKEGTHLNESDIVQHVGRALAYFKVPRYIEIVQSLPYTPTGRVKKAELIAQEKERADHGWDREKEMPDWRRNWK